MNEQELLDWMHFSYGGELHRYLFTAGLLESGLMTILTDRLEQTKRNCPCSLGEWGCE